MLYMLKHWCADEHNLKWNSKRVAKSSNTQQSLMDGNDSIYNAQPFIIPSVIKKSKIEGSVGMGSIS